MNKINVDRNERSMVLTNWKAYNYKDIKFLNYSKYDIETNNLLDLTKIKKLPLKDLR